MKLQWSRLHGWPYFK